MAKCPACGAGLDISGLVCRSCETRIEGRFDPCPFCRLDADEAGFLMAFVRAGGAIKDVEKDLGISYPTVKNRLAKVQAALGLTSQEPEAGDASADRIQVLEKLQKGELSFEEALEKLG